MCLHHFCILAALCLALDASAEQKTDLSTYPVYARGDLDGDADDDGVALFCLEGLHGGNYWQQFIAVSLTTNPKMIFLEVGSKGVRGIENVCIENQMIVLDAKDYAPGDSMAEPTIPKEIRYRIEKGRLVEVHNNKNQSSAPPKMSKSQR